MKTRKKEDRLRKLRDSWNKVSMLPYIENRTGFRYSQKSQKDEIAEALELWHFSMIRLQNEEWEIRRDYLRDFVEKNSNRSVRLIAMIEMMPTTVWRAILGEYNLDYMSAESFLRRVTSGQEELIRLNYKDIIEHGEIPRVLKQRRCFKKWTVENLLQEPLNFKRRYVNRAAMSHNLVNLDFGYNAYPNGKNDDLKVMGQKSLRKFFSKKNHSDDFSVNTDYGRYWWFYRTARSNYVFKPDREVVLKDHICPPFHYTWIIHFLFWILSPLACISMAAMIMKGHTLPFIEFLPVYVISVFTPIWCLLAALRYLLAKVGSALVDWVDESEGIDKIAKWVSEKKDLLSKSFKIALGTACTGWFFYGTGPLFVFLNGAFGKPAAIWLTMMVYILVGYSVYFRIRKKYLPRFKDFPGYFRIPLYATAVSIIGYSSAIYHEQVLKVYSFIGAVIRYAVILCVEILEVLGISGLSLGIILLAILVFRTIAKKMSEQRRERLFVLMDRFGLMIANVLALILVSFTALQIYLAVHTFGIVPILGSAGILFAIYVLIVVILWKVVMKIDPQINSLELVTNDLKREMKYEFYISVRGLQKNRWFRTLSREQQLLAGREIKKTITYIFGYRYDHREKAFSLMISHMNEKTVSLLKESQAWLEISELKFEIFRQMVKNNMRFKEASIIVEEREAKREAVLKWTKSILKVISCPFLLLLKAIFYPFLSLWRVLKSCGKIIADIVSLIGMVNNRCPYSVKPEIVRVVVD